MRDPKSVIRSDTPNAETIEALEEVQQLKTDANARKYDSFAEILKRGIS